MLDILFRLQHLQFFYLHIIINQAADVSSYVNFFSPNHIFNKMDLPNCSLFINSEQKLSMRALQEGVSTV
jgi:hypothetical protein